MCALMRAFGRAAKLAVPILGIALVAAALTAGLTGADPEGNWGPARRQILVLGIALMAGWAIAVVWPGIDRFLVSLSSRAFEAATAATGRVIRTRPIRGMAQAAGWLLRPLGRLAAPLRPPLFRLGAWLRQATAGRERQVRLICLAVFALAAPVYLWIVSVGYWAHWPPETRYYSDLADSFQHGQLHLLVAPDPELLALADPYDPQQRGQIPFVWDVALFEGRFYIYWGPVPAVLVAGWKTLVQTEVGDNSLVFGFTLAVVLFTVLLAGECFVSLFPHLRTRSALGPLLVAAFAYPLPWLTSKPGVYEASIAAGQAFLMGALYLAARVFLGERRSFPRLGLAGVFLAFAVGSRASLAMASAVWIALFLVGVWRSQLWNTRRGERWVAGFVLLAPFLLGIASLGWYNTERFGSPFEVGFRYQLTGMDLNRDYSQAFSPLNIPTNLYTYTLTGVETAGSFPWIRPRLGNTRPPPLAWAALHIPGAQALTPPLYYSEAVTGVLYAFPFSLFAVVGLGLSLQALCSGMPRAESPPDGPARKPGPTVAAKVSLLLFGGGAAAFAPTLLFAFATARYLADLTPVLAVLSALGAWILLLDRTEKGATTWWVNLLVWVLGFLSIAISLVLAFQGYALRFERLNPEVYELITDFLTW